MKRFIFYSFLAFSLFFCLSCRKKPNTIGSNLQPEGSLITAVFDDSQYIETKVLRVDSLNTKSALYALLGNVNDPIFGNSNYQFYTQLAPTTTSYGWGNNAVCDSMVLQLKYENFYGDTTNTQTVNIFRLTEDMLMLDTVYYYSNKTVACNPDAIGTLTFQPRPYTNSNIDNDTLTTPVLRVPLNQELGQEFINAGISPFTSADAFKEFFKGVKVCCNQDEATGAALYFSLTSAETYMRVYYHNDNDTTYYDFNVNSNSELRFNHFQHDYNSVGQPISFDKKENQLLYVQGTAGVRSWVKFTNLKKWAEQQEGHVLVHQAKLILSGAPIDSITFKPITDMIVVAAKDSVGGGYSLITDYSIGAAYYGGTYDINTNEIYFRVSEYVTERINTYGSEEDFGLYFYTNYGSYDPRRWVFYGDKADDNTKRIRLELTYSIVKE